MVRQMSEGYMVRQILVWNTMRFGNCDWVMEVADRRDRMWSSCK